MSGYNETPLALSTSGNGRFNARISRDETEIQWELSFGDLEGTVTQSHIHFGASSQTGGVSISVQILVTDPLARWPVRRLPRKTIR